MNAAEFAQLVEDLHNDYRLEAAVVLGCDAGDVTLGWKLTHVDGTSYGEFQWPMPILRRDAPVVVKATNPVRANTGSCPMFPGDGLCAATLDERQEVTSGTVTSWSHAVGHVLAWTAADVLTKPYFPGKMRLRRVADIGIFDPLALARDGLVRDLYWAELGGANLREANLRGVILGKADLRGADLGRADLRGADLRGAILRGADLRYADLTGALYRGADLDQAIR